MHSCQAKNAANLQSGTCPGLNLVYGHCNLLIKHHDMFIVVGPGHGAPALLANLFLQGALDRFYQVRLLLPCYLTQA